MSKRAPRVLFICSQFGARARFAAAFARQVLPEGAVVDCAGFQSGPFGPLIGRLRDEFGLDFVLESPPSVFRFYSSSQHYDYVVFLCNTAVVDLCSLFQEDVDTLFDEGETLVRWVSQPFSELTGDEESRLRAARDIVADIRDKVQALADQIETGEVMNTIPWKCAPRPPA